MGRLTKRTVIGVVVRTGDTSDAIKRLADYEDAEERGDIAPVIHARWIPKGGSFRCGHCWKKTLWGRDGATGGWSYEFTPIQANYCPYCGAKMDAEIPAERSYRLNWLYLNDNGKVCHEFLPLREMTLELAMDGVESIKKKEKNIIAVWVERSEKQADGQHKNVETTHLEVFVDAFGYRTWFPNKKDD